MKKELLQLAGKGVIDGVFIGCVISLVVSLLIGDGSYYAVHPQLIERMGGEMNAVLVQTFLCALLGLLFSVGSIIWRIEKWNLLQQTAVYFALACIVMFPIAYFLGWMQASISGVLCFVGSFVFVFVLVWLVNYWICRARVKELNKLVKER